MGFFDVIMGREAPETTAAREALRSRARAKVNRIEREIEALDRDHAREVYRDGPAHRAIRRNLDRDLRVARQNLADLG
ncbi:hypothetical protein ACFQZ2_01780 [Streptomonospora algeriensis]|uniref:PspA/IM30 family protein n=1 Tax=Streptomonospora algeriensis TaxID=995084 RepID=A0ABW3BC82_9ACTN